MTMEWDSDNIEIMQDDCLEFLRVVFFELYTYKFFKICSLIFLTIHVPMWAEQYYQYVKTFDPVMLAQYGPTSLVFLYAYICIIIPIIFEKYTSNYFMIRNTFFWSLNTASEELRKKIQKQINAVLLLAKIDLFLGVLTYTLFVTDIEKSDGGEFIYQVTFLKKYFPTYSHILVIIFYASLSYMVIPMMEVIFIMTYVGQHLFYQTDMYNEYVSRITENYTNNTHLFYDERYQRQVFERLRFISIRGLSLKRLVMSQIRQLHPLFVMFTTLGMFLVVCFVVSWRLVTNTDYPSFLMIIVISAFTALIIIETGSITEAKSLETYENMCKLPWYTFNVQNQKLFFIMLFHASFPIILSPFRDFPVNRTLIVKFYKVAYSVFTLATNMGERIQW